MSSDQGRGSNHGKPAFAGSGGGIVRTPQIGDAMGFIQRAYAELYLHLVWGTWNRTPLITSEMASQLHANLAHQCRRNGANVIAIGGIADHVHVFARFPTTISVAEFARRLKGASSHFVTHILRHSEPFKWQGGYGAFTVSRRGVESVREYVRNQETRHDTGSLIRVLERTGT